MPGSRSLVGAAPYAANDDRRYDQVLWSSDAPAVVAVSPAGRLTRGRQGRATITARAGRAAQSFTVVVAPNPVASLVIEPATANGSHRGRGPLRRSRAGPATAGQ